MKIALVFDRFLYGGIERVGISYMEILTKMGHMVDVYILSDSVEDLAREIPAACPVHVLPYSLHNCPESAWPQVLESERPVAGVLLFSLKYAARSLLHALTRRHFLAQSDCRYDLAVAFSGHIRDLTFVSGGCLSAAHRLAWLHGAQYQYAVTSPGFFRLYKKINNLVCLSELCDAECLRFNQNHGIVKRKILNPLSLAVREADEQKVRELRTEHGDFCLMVGRLARDKDQRTVIRAMKFLRDSLGCRKKLLLVGDGPERGALENFAAELGMGEDVVFTGARADVQNYYRAAFAYVHAAYLEGLPTVFLEAMSCGLPVVSTDAVPGAREILGDDEFGLLSPNDDAEALARNIKRLYDSDELRLALIEKGARRTRDFGPDVIGGQLDEYLRQIAAQE